MNRFKQSRGFNQRRGESLLVLSEAEGDSPKGEPKGSPLRFALFLAFVLATTVLVLIPNSVRGAVPNLINFQGILKTPGGQPVADGFYTVRFRIHDDSTAGTSLWEETVAVQTVGGLFSVRLGDGTALPNTIFSTGTNRFVGVKVNADTLVPRTRLISVPYALHSLRSDSAATATVSLDLTCTGCVGTSDVDATQVQRRVSGTAGAGQYITAINQDGSVVTAADAGSTGSGWMDDGTTVRLLTDADKVGIGTASPTKKLEVAGSIKVGTNDTVFSSNICSNSPLRLQAPAGTTRMYIDDLSGDVGLGTATPARNLHIFRNDNTSVGLRIDNPNVGGAAQERIDFGSSGLANISVFGASNRMSIVNNRTSGAVEFEVGGTQRLFISNGGNVGIGTTGPAKKLEVIGSIKGDTVFSNVLSSNSPLRLNAPAATTRMFINDANGNVGIGTTSPVAKLQVAAGSGEGLPGTVAGLLVNNNASAGDAAAVTIIAGSSGVASLALGNNAQAVKGGLTYNNSSNDLTIYGSGAAVAVLKGGSGNLGIGELSPVNQLDVAGGAAIDFAYAGTNVAPPNGLLVEGNVGIGTTSGFNTLDVEGRAAIGAGYAGTNGAPANGLLVEGNVGIGTTSPTKKLEVAGSIKVGSGDTVFSSNISSNSSMSLITPTFGPFVRMYIQDTTGNVGIGTTSPSTRLSVAGGQLSADAGTSAAPAYTFAGDLNTGIYNTSPDFVSIATGGAERVRVGPTGLLSVLSRVQIGTTTLFGDPSTLHVQGSIATDVTTVVGPTTLTGSHSVVLVNTGVTTITLPGAVFVPGRQYTIKKISAAAGIVTVDGAGAETIDGAATHSLTVQYEYVTIVCNGTSWFVVADN